MLVSTDSRGSAGNFFSGHEPSPLQLKQPLPVANVHTKHSEVTESSRNPSTSQLLGAAETLNTKRDMQPERKQIQSLSSRPMTQSECFILVSSVGHRIWVIHFELPSLIVVLGSTKFG